MIRKGVAVTLLIWILAVGGGLWNMCDEQRAHFVPFKGLYSFFAQQQAGVSTLSSCASQPSSVANLVTDEPHHQHKQALQLSD